MTVPKGPGDSSLNREAIIDKECKVIDMEGKVIDKECKIIDYRGKTADVKTSN